MRSWRWWLEALRDAWIATSNLLLPASFLLVGLLPGVLD